MIFFFSIFIFLSSAAPASSSTPVPLSHLDSEYHFHLPSPCRWLSASHSVSVWRDLLHRVIIPLCWWRAALGFRGANELRRRHQAAQIRWGAALPPGRGAWKALLWETLVILDHIPSRKKWEVQYPWSQLALGQHPLRKLLPPGNIS